MTWAFSKYKEELDEDESNPIWDELEHSVIASLSDDLIVASRNKSIDVIVVKKFSPKILGINIGHSSFYWYVRIFLGSCGSLIFLVHLCYTTVISTRQE